LQMRFHIIPSHLGFIVYNRVPKTPITTQSRSKEVHVDANWRHRALAITPHVPNLHKRRSILFEGIRKQLGKIHTGGLGSWS